MPENPENPNFLKIHKLKRFAHINFVDFVNDIIGQNENTHYNDAFDIGSRDYYYKRKLCPRIITARVQNPETNKYEDQYKSKENMTEEEINNYYKGYYYSKFIVQTRK